MPSDLAHTVAALRDVVLADGNTYRLAPLDLTDWGEIDVWLEGFIKEKAERVYRDAPAAIKEEGLRVAYARAARISFSSPEGVTMMMTSAGVQQTLWRALRRHHPALTVDDVRRLWNDEVDRAIEKKLKEANQAVNPTVPEGGTASPTSP